MFRKGKFQVALIAGALLFALNVGTASAQENLLGDLLGSVGNLVGEQNISTGSAVQAKLPNGDQIGASAVYNNKQTGLNGLTGSLLGGSYSTTAQLSGPNNLAAVAYTNGDYGLASTVRALSSGLGGLLGNK